MEVALPIFVAQDKQGSAALLGAFWTVFGIGAVMGGLLAATLRNLPLWRVVAVVIVGWGVALLPLRLWGELVPGFVGFAVGGLIYGPFISITTALFQRTSPPELLSSVLATRGALTIPATALGTLVGGPLIGVIGAQDTLLASALLTIVLGLAVAVTQVRFGGSTSRSGSLRQALGGWSSGRRGEGGHASGASQESPDRDADGDGEHGHGEQ